MQMLQKVRAGGCHPLHLAQRPGHRGPLAVCLLAHHWYMHAHRHSLYEALFLIDCPTQQASHLFGVEVGMEVHGGQHRGSHLYPVGLRARLSGPWLAPVAVAFDHVVLWLPWCCCNTNYLQELPE